jgi:hypothetical protein
MKRRRRSVRKRNRQRIAGRQAAETMTTTPLMPAGFLCNGKRPPIEEALLVSTLWAHGQFTAKDVRPPNNPAAKMLAFLEAKRTE